MEETVLPRLAFDILKEAEETYKETGTFSSKILENLYSFFGESFVLATELLEKCKIIEYGVDSGIRNIFKVIMKEQYTIYEDINFCQCKTFRLQVLESRHTLTCKHVLAVKLARISGQLTKETISDSQFVDFLNEQLRYIEEDDD
ncbi:zinc finger SWIM domain-containing protein 7-like [Anoplophora glabripennis]|uniref:zinc finger SWIM domain-containing protein 7-like n=1 Tax=Anoplophora glabripennis TaxID=217634 RepID=UPI000874570E|nr:zinc finger SWIM domain-containing protein 7-like [Anoplophora glabripennis]